MLQGRTLGDGAPDPRFILLHPDCGVVLLDAAPDRTPDAVARLRRRLRAGHIAERFPGHLPVIYCSLTEQDLWRLSVLLDTAFGAEEPMDLEGGEWMAALDALLPPAAPPAESLPVRHAEAVTAQPPVPRPLASAAPPPPPQAEMPAAPVLPFAPPPPRGEAGLVAGAPAALPSSVPRQGGFSRVGWAALVLLAATAGGAVALQRFAPYDVSEVFHRLNAMLRGDHSVPAVDAAPVAPGPRRATAMAEEASPPPLPAPQPVALTGPAPPAVVHPESGTGASAIMVMRAEPARAGEPPPIQAAAAKPAPAAPARPMLPPLPATPLTSLRAEAAPVPLVGADPAPIPSLSPPLALELSRPPSVRDTALVAAATELPLAASPEPVPLFVASADPVPQVAEEAEAAATPAEPESVPLAAPTPLPHAEAPEPVAASPAPPEVDADTGPLLRDMLPASLGDAMPAEADAPAPEATLAESRSTVAPDPAPAAGAMATDAVPPDTARDAGLPGPAPDAVETPPQDAAPAPSPVAEAPAEPVPPAPGSPAPAMPPSAATMDPAPEGPALAEPAPRPVPPAPEPAPPGAPPVAAARPEAPPLAAPEPAREASRPVAPPPQPSRAVPPVAEVPAVPQAERPAEPRPPLAAPEPAREASRPVAPPPQPSRAAPPVAEVPAVPQAERPAEPRPPLAAAAPAREAPRPPEPPATPARPAVQAAPAMAPELLAALMRRGDSMLAIGDLSAARLLYERAATGGSGSAALAMGKTYDPAFLADLNARGIRPDRAAAVTWYRKAAMLGNGEAAALLRRLGAE